MKRSMPLVIVVACLGGSLQAQETDKLSRTIVKLSPQHFIHNSLKAGVERFNKNHTGSFALFLTGMIENNEYAFDEGYSGLAAEIQFRKYVSPMKRHTSKNDHPYYQGIYGAGYVQGGSYWGSFEGDHYSYDPGGNFTSEHYKYDESVGNYGLGFTIGYQRTFWQVIFMDVFVGGGIQFSDKTRTGQVPADRSFDYSGITDPDYKGALPKIGVHIGIGL